MKYVREEVLKAAFVTMLNKLIFSRKHILKPLLEQLKANSNDENVRRMQELQKRLESHAEKKNTLHRLYAQKVIESCFIPAGNECFAETSGVLPYGNCTVGTGNTWRN